MVSLAVKKDGLHSNTLRDLAFWYPEIPKASLHLNDDCFTAKGSSTIRYRPLCWTMFGGHKGEYLRSLTWISVTFIGQEASGIEFRYNSTVPDECRWLGRYEGLESATERAYAIDGPG